MSHPVIFVSLGPGDPELITVKGLKALEDADFIFSPSTLLGNDKHSSRSTDILLNLGIDQTKIKEFVLTMNKERSDAIGTYQQIANQIKELHKSGFKIAVTAEGDTGFYSSVHYIIDNLKDIGIPVKRIAGVPAFIASGSLANIHIVKQEEELNIIPGII